ncbi:heme-copper oxidase family protein [Hydrogenimonas cancrithermarum]|uniref:Membrane protein n=1 Tax=Hydrogenimonas cancrithermarum TaxID=2993563 RepID=A0ABM8FPH8_9BACT|nr:hypothetical protein [Hydrogenimonas cancrithermarum]BDY13667.1 membrane protein [Hydrogenimonas cancrithermarum]
MFNVSREFAPPFSLIAPFFVIGSIFYLIASFLLPMFGADASHFDISVVGWAHLFLLGFVMMIIFGAMAQLVPVVLEVGHFSVDFYYVIWPLLGIGTILMVLGFWLAPGMLPYGGMMVLISMLIFLADTIMTLRKVEHVSLTVKTVAVTNGFLLLGILVGFAMALGIGAGVGVDISKWLNAHIVLVLGGYVTLTIMGMSLILLPMFGLSHGFDEKPINLSFKIMVGGVLFYLIATLFDSKDFRFLAMLTMIGAMGLYLYQIWLIYKTRARKEYDIWFKSMLFGYGSLALSLPLGFVAVMGGPENVGLAAVWFLVMGFFTFLINGHLYKIIPFLVWFERYSPLVGKERVPMLAEMYPKKEAEYEFWFSAAGVTIAGFGLLFSSDTMFKAGATFIAIGAIFLVQSVVWMMNFGKK